MITPAMFCVYGEYERRLGAILNVPAVVMLGNYRHVLCCLDLRTYTWDFLKMKARQLASYSASQGESPTIIFHRCGYTAKSLFVN